jgi:multidrug resistance efflux pump
MGLTAAAMMAVPWQQSAAGSGRVVAFSALEREQLIEAPIEGRIVGWWVYEGSRVRAGEKLVELSDNDPEILTRLGRERDAVMARLEAARAQAGAYQRQIEALESSRSLGLEAADAKIRMAENKVKAAENKITAAEAALRASKLNLGRQKQLAQEGLASDRTFELADFSFAKDKTEVFVAKAELEGARADVLGQKAGREKVNADAIAKIESARSYVEKARSDAAKAEEELAKVEVRLSRQTNMIVRAPRDGTIVRVLAREGGEWVKSGDPLLLLVPDTDARAVELWVDGNDASLISPGRHVRLQFEGWPAIQFTGWPSVAVGTFGGTVAFVDAVANAQGKFRVVVVPEEHQWPSTQYLRQGVRAHGWILLNEVTLGFEIWRQLNGFPPAVAPPEPQDSLMDPTKDKKSKETKKQDEDK